MHEKFSEAKFSSLCGLSNLLHPAIEEFQDYIAMAMATTVHIGHHADMQSTSMIISKNGLAAKHYKYDGGSTCT